MHQCTLLCVRLYCVKACTTRYNRQVMEFVDTHCHIQFPDYKLDPEEVRKAAMQAGVTRLLCVGCTLDDSKAAIAFAAQNKGVWATIGIHPHEANDYVHEQERLQQFRRLVTQSKVVAIGEAGLDYYYEHSSRQNQQQLLRFQLDLAVTHKLPMVFHVRDAFDDFWPIFDEYTGVQGVIHSFTAGEKELEEIVARGLYVGLNGIMTFTKDARQLAAARKVPLKRLVLETDAPFLTPIPFRGKICEPKYVRETAAFLAGIRGERLDDIAAATTRNARRLFKI